MTTLELKGGMIEMIARVENRDVLQYLYETVADIANYAWTADYDLSPDQQAALDTDLDASYDPSNLHDQQAALQKMERWLK